MSNLPQPTLMMRRSELTLFAENESESADRPIEGLTLSLSVESGAKTLKLGPVEYSCGADTADRAADEFDAF